MIAKKDIIWQKHLMPKLTLGAQRPRVQSALTLKANTVLNPNSPNDSAEEIIKASDEPPTSYLLGSPLGMVHGHGSL